MKNSEQFKKINKIHLPYGCKCGLSQTKLCNTFQYANCSKHSTANVADSGELCRRVHIIIIIAFFHG